LYLRSGRTLKTPWTPSCLPKTLVLCGYPAACRAIHTNTYTHTNLHRGERHALAHTYATLHRAQRDATSQHDPMCVCVRVCVCVCAHTHMFHRVCAHAHDVWSGQRTREERLPLQMFKRLLLPLERTFWPACGCAVPRTRCRPAPDFFLPRFFTTLCPAPPDAAGARDAVSSGCTGPATRPAHRAMLLGVPP
jgi:hypothetical protein